MTFYIWSTQRCRITNSKFNLASDKRSQIYSVMEKIKDLKVEVLSKSAMLRTRGGNPILVGLGVLSTLIGLGKAADQASEWFVEGWNNPK